MSRIKPLIRSSVSNKAGLPSGSAPATLGLASGLALLLLSCRARTRAATAGRARPSSGQSDQRRRLELHLVVGRLGSQATRGFRPQAGTSRPGRGAGADLLVPGLTLLEQRQDGSGDEDRGVRARSHPDEQSEREVLQRLA